MKNAQTITYIRFVFHGSDLFEGREDANRYEHEASAQKYSGLCQEKLEQEYPGVEVEVIDAETGTELPSQVLGLNDNDEDEELELPDELERVRDICETEVYEKFKWRVPREWKSSIEIQVPSPIPSISVIDWVCRQELVDEAECVDGVWEFPWEKWIDWWDETLAENRILETCEDILGFCAAEDEIRSTFKCYPGNILQFPITDLPPELEVLFIAPGEFGQHLLQVDSSSVILSIYPDYVGIEITHFYKRSQWRYTWDYRVYAQTIAERSQERGIKAKAYDVNFRIECQHPFSQIETLENGIQQTSNVLSQLILETEECLSGKPVWKALYERNEDAFCKEVLLPLLKKMGFDVRYTHGQHEYGKDFVFWESTKFGKIRYCALQAKAGNISGSVGSQIREIFEQIEIGFEKPFKILNGEEKYISEFVVAISGDFTHHAQERIQVKLRKLSNVGSVYFWDKDEILHLIDEFYSGES
jgi:hypothetical protein